jgi:hypothetical protein
MRNILKRTVSAVSLGMMVIGLMFSAAPSAHACSCMMPEAPEASLSKSDAVFAGTVTDIASKEQGMSRIVTFSADRAWKGITEKTVSVSTALDSAACGIDFQIGKAYVVYAYASEEGGLSASLCSRTHEVSAASIDADQDVVALGTTTVALSDLKPHESAMGSTAVTLVIGLLAVAAGIGAFRAFGMKKPEAPTQP